MFDPKRQLGQNFFTNKSLAIKIVETTISPSDGDLHILEIGPGTGVFTHLFHQQPNLASYTAIEKDDELFAFLDKHFADAVFHHIDVLDDRVYNEILPALPDNTTVYGSLPYNISKPIIRKFVQTKFKHQFYIIQKEVAEKYAAKDSNNVLSLTLSLYADIKILFDINRESFRPRPKVTSSFIHITQHDRYNHLSPQHLAWTEKLISTAFTRPRKTLQNNLKSLNLSAEIPSDMQRLRPHQLDIDQYIALAKQLHS